MFDYWMMGIGMVLAMLAFMRFRSYNWRHCWEMTIAMLAPVAGLTLLVLSYAVSARALHGLGDLLMILAMAAYMLVRRDEHAQKCQHVTHRQVEEGAK